MKNECYECDENGIAMQNKPPSKLERAKNLVSETKSLVSDASQVFNSVVSNQMLNAIIENRNALAQLDRGIAKMQAEGAERRANLQQVYESNRSQLEGINDNIALLIEGLNRFDVNTMNEVQTNSYNLQLRLIYQLRADAMKKLQDIFG